jgi:predicted amidophosphoribosyltransferase
MFAYYYARWSAGGIPDSLTLMQPNEPVYIQGGWVCAFCQHSSSQATELCAACGKPRLDVAVRPVRESKVRSILAVNVNMHRTNQVYMTGP